MAARAAMQSSTQSAPEIDLAPFAEQFARLPPYDRRIVFALALTHLPEQAKTLFAVEKNPVALILGAAQIASVQRMQPALLDWLLSQLAENGAAFGAHAQTAKILRQKLRAADGQDGGVWLTKNPPQILSLEGKILYSRIWGLARDTLQASELPRPDLLSPPAAVQFGLHLIEQSVQRREGLYDTDRVRRRVLEAIRAGAPELFERISRAPALLTYLSQSPVGRLAAQSSGLGDTSLLLLSRRRTPLAHALRCLAMSELPARRVPDFLTALDVTTVSGNDLESWLKGDPLVTIGTSLTNEDFRTAAVRTVHAATGLFRDTVASVLRDATLKSFSDTHSLPLDEVNLVSKNGCPSIRIKGVPSAVITDFPHVRIEQSSKWYRIDDGFVALTDGVVSTVTASGLVTFEPSGFEQIRLTDDGDGLLCEKGSRVTFFERRGTTWQRVFCGDRVTSGDSCDLYAANRWRGEVSFLRVEGDHTSRFTGTSNTRWRKSLSSAISVEIIEEKDGSSTFVVENHEHPERSRTFRQQIIGFFRDGEDFLFVLQDGNRQTIFVLQGQELTPVLARNNGKIRVGDSESSPTAAGVWFEDAANGEQIVVFWGGPAVILGPGEGGWCGEAYLWVSEDNLITSVTKDGEFRSFQLPFPCRIFCRDGLQLPDSSDLAHYFLLYPKGDSRRETVAVWWSNGAFRTARHGDFAAVFTAPRGVVALTLDSSRRLVAIMGDEEPVVIADDVDKVVVSDPEIALVRYERRGRWYHVEFERGDDIPVLGLNMTISLLNRDPGYTAHGHGCVAVQGAVRIHGRWSADERLLLLAVRSKADEFLVVVPKTQDGSLLAFPQPTISPRENALLELAHLLDSTNSFLETAPIAAIRERCRALAALFDRIHVNGARKPAEQDLFPTVTPYDVDVLESLRVERPDELMGAVPATILRRPMFGLPLAGWGEFVLVEARSRDGEFVSNDYDSIQGGHLFAVQDGRHRGGDPRAPNGPAVFQTSVWRIGFQPIQVAVTYDSSFDRWEHDPQLPIFALSRKTRESWTVFRTDELVLELMGPPGGGIVPDSLTVTWKDPSAAGLVETEVIGSSLMVRFEPSPTPGETVSAGGWAPISAILSFEVFGVFGTGPVPSTSNFDYCRLVECAIERFGRGCLEPLAPLPPAVRRWLPVLRGLPICERISTIQALVRFSGVYDMGYKGVTNIVSGLRQDEQLDFAMVRARALKESYSLLPRAHKQWTGVCHEATLFAINLFRAAGIPAGYCDGALMMAGSSRPGDAHVEPFILWADQDGQLAAAVVPCAPCGSGTVQAVYDGVSWLTNSKLRRVLNGADVGNEHADGEAGRGGVETMVPVSRELRREAGALTQPINAETAPMPSEQMMESNGAQLLAEVLSFLRYGPSEEPAAPPNFGSVGQHRMGLVDSTATIRDVLKDHLRRIMASGKSLDEARKELLSLIEAGRRGLPEPVLQAAQRAVPSLAP
jgi:hypothetical protein